MSTYVCAFIFSYEQSSVLEHCDGAQPPAATLWNAWLLFLILYLSHPKACNNCPWNIFLPVEYPSTHREKSTLEKKKSSDIGCLWHKTIFISTLDGKKRILTISKRLFVLVPCPPRHGRGFCQTVPDAGAESPFSGRREGGKCFLKSLGTQPLVLRHPLLLWKLYYLQFWIELNYSPCERQGQRVMWEIPSYPIGRPDIA